MVLSFILLVILSFVQLEGQLKGIEQLKNTARRVVVIGGDALYHGAFMRLTEHGFPAIGLPGTPITTYRWNGLIIGFDTVENLTAMMQSIRSVIHHQVTGRTFKLLEVMT